MPEPTTTLLPWRITIRDSTVAALAHYPDHETVLAVAKAHDADLFDVAVRFDTAAI